MNGKFFFEEIVFLIHNLGYVGLNLCLCYSLLLQQLFLHTLALFFKYHLFKFVFIALEMSLFRNLYKEQLHQLYHVYFTLLNDCYIRINVWYIKAFLELRDFIKCTFLSYLNLLRQYSRVNALQLAIKLSGFSLLSFLLFSIVDHVLVCYFPDRVQSIFKTCITIYMYFSLLEDPVMVSKVKECGCKLFIYIN